MSKLLDIYKNPQQHILKRIAGGNKKYALWITSWSTISYCIAVGLPALTDPVIPHSLEGAHNYKIGSYILNSLKF
jgi:hypothetical protein